jgi:hypothetical protein
MTYVKPQVVLIANAVDLVQRGTVKPGMYLECDCQYTTTAAAYEADE